MSGSGAYSELAAELLKWLRQNDRPEGAWFLDEGAPAPLEGMQAPSAPPAPAENAAQPQTEPQAQPQPPSQPAPAAVAAAAATPAAVEDDDPFAAECRTFVSRALDSIAGHDRDETLLPGLLAAEPATDPEAALVSLRDEVLPCTACELHTSRHNVVFGAGSARADLVIVGEAPGRDEDLQGEPFVGRSGRLLTKILAAIDLAREDVFICNILKCRPPQNRDPLPPEVLACEPHLTRQLAIIRPRVICCLGRVAAQTLLGTSVSLGRLRGGVHFYRDIPVVVTYHPAYLLRNPAAKRDTWNDVRKLKALLEALAQSEGKGTGNHA